MVTDGSTDFPKDMDPTSVVDAFNAAWNAGDVERALSFFADGAVVRFMYPTPFPEPDTYTGEDEIRQLLKGFLGENFQVETSDHRMSLNEVTWRYRAASDRFRKLGVEEVDGASGASFEAGKIKRLTISFSPESTAAIEAGLDRAGVGGPISEGLAGLQGEIPAVSESEGEPGPESAKGEAGNRPNRGPSWDPVGLEEPRPPTES